MLVFLFVLGIPKEPLIVDWVDYLHELVHKEDIQNEVDYEDYAKKLSMDEQTLKNCIHKKDRIRTARNIGKRT